MVIRMSLLCLALFLVSCLVLCSANDDLLKFIGRQNFNYLYGKEDYGDISYEIFTPTIIYPNENNYLGKVRRMSEFSEEHYLKIDAFGESFHLHMKKNPNMIALQHKFSTREADGTEETFDGAYLSECIYHGKDIFDDDTFVALTTCNGITGLIRTKSADYFVQKLPREFAKDHEIDSHLIYKTTISERFCGLDETQFIQKSSINFTRQSRSFPNAYYGNKLTIETAIFIDYSLFQHLIKIYQWDTEQHTAGYIMAIVNAMQLIYNEGSLTDKPIMFVIIKLEIFKTDQVGFQITDDGSKYLDNFCYWQQSINNKDDSAPDHWDHALMFTGVNIHLNGKYTVAGLAYVGVMCDPLLSCTLSEAIGLESIFIATHESGHTFGLQHDGEKNSCEKRKYMMATFVHHYPHPWSPCSREELKTFLLNPITTCLLDTRTPDFDLDHEKNGNILFGQMFDSDEQCQLQFGRKYLRDRSYYGEEMCNKLICTNGFETKVGISSYDGTTCGEKKWCDKGKCVPLPSYFLQPSMGDWLPFNEIVPCSSGCAERAIGLAIHMRKCKNRRRGDLAATCLGPKIMFEKCDDTSLCPSRKSVTEMANELCQKLKKDKPDLTGSGVMSDNSENCKVWCNSNYGYAPISEIFPDGTPCGANKYCIRNRCVNFSCGDVIMDKENLNSCK